MENNQAVREQGEYLSSVRVREIKHRWHFSSPEKLYDQCIKLLVRNIDLVLAANKKRSSQFEEEEEEEKDDDVKKKKELGAAQFQANDCVTSKLDAVNTRKHGDRSNRGEALTYTQILSFKEGSL